MPQNVQQTNEVRCAWCGKQIRPGNPSKDVSHGICLTCMADQGHFPIEDLTHCSKERLDSLPFGLIRTRGDGKIVFYNRLESTYSHLEPTRVIGKNFFHEVAPWTGVKEFAGALEEMRLRKRSGRKEFAFIFRFPTRSMLMTIVMMYQAETDLCTLLVRPDAEE